MSLYIQTWSAATAFSRWNDYDVRRNPILYVDENSLPPRFRDHNNLTATEDEYGVNIIADIIRELGYTVTCGIHRRENMSDSYIIMNIQTAEGQYIYGCSPDDEEFLGSNIQTRPLIGNRTVWNWQQWHNKQHQDIPSVCDKKLVAAINTGGEYFIKNSQVLSFYSSDKAICAPSYHNERVTEVLAWHDETGISTIGNTLPIDIVEALHTFTHDDIAFRKEPECEYYIPECCIYKEQACPVAEEIVSDPSLLATAATGSSNKDSVCNVIGHSISQSYSDSSSSDDDE